MQNQDITALETKIQALESEIQSLEKRLQSTNYATQKAKIKKQIEDKKIELAKFYNDLGFIYINMKKNQQAIKYLKQAIKINAKSIGAYHNLGVAYDNLEEFTTAKENYLQALEVNQNNGETYNNLGNIHRKLGDYKKAIEYFKKAIEYFNNSFKNSVVYSNLGIVYEILGNKPAAIENYLKAIELNSELVEAHNNLANLYENLGELEKAKPKYEKALELSKNLSEKIKEIIKEDYERFSEKYKNSLIKGSSENKNEFGKENLAFAVKKIAVKNFQAIKDLEISFPTDAQFICFLGQNGDGKTSILQALALGLQGAEGFTKLLNENTQIGVEFLENHKNEIHNLYKEKFVWTSFASCSNTVGYGAKRLDMTRQIRETWNKINPFYCLLAQKDEDLLNIENWLVDDFFEYGQETVFARQVMEVLQKLLPSVSQINRKKREIIYTEFGQDLRFEELSTGNKSLVSMIGDILIRLIGEVSEHSNLEKNRKITDLRDLEGIVLIDELETHLHPKWQKEFPKLLSEIFPKVQFIVSTHSAVCLLGMPKNTALYKVQRDSQKGTFAERINIDFINRLPNQLLTSVLFNMEDISSAFNEGEVRTEETESKILSQDQLRQRLQEIKSKYKFEQ